MFDNFNVNLRKNKGFLTYIPYIPIPEYGQSNVPLVICDIFEFPSLHGSYGNPSTYQGMKLKLNLHTMIRDTPYWFIPEYNSTVIIVVIIIIIIIIVTIVNIMVWYGMPILE